MRMCRATLNVVAETTISRSLRKFGYYMCKNSILVKASAAVAPITNGGGGQAMD